ncbi:hypothetical protein C6Q13_02955 [Burkholderia gladioli]|nr:hypothetical protein C6Q13_02955 [Burkholderia gladioli]
MHRHTGKQSRDYKRPLCAFLVQRGAGRDRLARPSRRPASSVMACAPRGASAVRPMQVDWCRSASIGTAHRPSGRLPEPAADPENAWQAAPVSRGTGGPG